MNHINLNYVASCLGLFIGCLIVGNRTKAQDCALPTSPVLELHATEATVTGAASNRWGALIWSSNSLPEVPFGSGLLCVSYPTGRGPMFLTDASGSATTVMPPTGVHCQAFVREPGGWTLSNRIYITNP